MTEIAKNAFYRKTTPVTITIPATVKVLQPYALAECKSLEKLVIEPGRAVIPEQFCNCCRNLKEVILPEGITEIGERAFHACRLFHIVLPDSLKVIGDNAFWETPLLEISLPDGIESVGHGAFQGSAVSEIIIPGSCRHIGDDVCTPENLKTMVICSDDILPKPFSWQKNANDKFSTNFLFHSFLDEKDKMNPKATIYCSPAVKKRMPKCWSGKIRPLSEWTGKGGASQADVKTDEKFPVYRLPDEIIRRLFLGDADPVEVLDKKKFPRKSMMSVETASGTVEVVNRAYPDIKNLKNYFGLWPGGYDMYDAMDYYLPKEEVASRINIFDRGHSDAAYFAKPEIDWKAPELTKTQAATRILFLTAVVDRCLDSDVLKQIIASVPKKKDGTFVKNRVTRIASGNIVSQDAQVLEFAAKADSDKSLTLYVDYRPFSGEELAIIESDFLSTHFSIMKRDLAPEAVREAVIASGYPSRQKAIRELRKAYLTGEDEWTAVWKKRFGEDPVFRSLATSLVWILREQLNDKCTFMVKKDGLCVSSDGTELVLPDHFKIAVAYGPHLEDEELAKWKTVFAAEGIDQLFMQLDETRYDGFALEVTDSPKHDYNFYHSPSGEKIVTRYDGVDVWYGSLKECLADGYEYEAYPDQQEKIHFPLKTAFMWAPMDGSNTFYPYEDLVFDKEIHLGEWFLPGYDAEYSVLPRSINHFLFMMDKACLKDAIRRHDLSLLKGRSKFLSPANIAECIELAKEQDAADCLAWLEEQANNRR